MCVCVNDSVRVLCAMPLSLSEEWSREQQSCVKQLQEGVNGVLSLLCEFSRRQMNVGRERNSDLQDSITHTQTTAKNFQVGIELVLC